LPPSLLLAWIEPTPLLAAIQRRPLRPHRRHRRRHRPACVRARRATRRVWCACGGRYAVSPDTRPSGAGTVRKASWSSVRLRRAVRHGRRAEQSGEVRRSNRSAATADGVYVSSEVSPFGEGC